MKGGNPPWKTHKETPKTQKKKQNIDLNVVSCHLVLLNVKQN